MSQETFMLRTLLLPAPLLGAIPELDSMAVLGVLTQIQDDFGVQIDDDEVSADIFQTFGDLKRFVEAKLG